MTLVKWTPRPMTVFNEVDNMINSVFNRDWNLEPIQSTEWNPAVDVKETDNKSYTDFEKIKKEVEDAKNTFKKYKWPIIDVTRKSVEETAASVIKIYEIYKQNV